MILGSTSDVPVISMDFFPTILEAAGLEPAPGEPLDGESLMPVLRQDGLLQRDAIFFHYPNYAFHGANRLGGAIRQGDYKLIEFYDDGSVELYDLANDIGEQHDLSGQMPERAAGMKGELDLWLEASGANMPTPVGSERQAGLTGRSGAETQEQGAGPVASRISQFRRLRPASR